VALAEDDESSGRGEFHSRALSEPDVRLSPHPALTLQPWVRLCIRHRLLPSLVDRHLWPESRAPSLRPHYQGFIATTGPSAPSPRIGTRLLMGPPLGVLPSHRGDRFPRSAQEPAMGSRAFMPSPLEQSAGIPRASSRACRSRRPKIGLPPPPPPHRRPSAPRSAIGSESLVLSTSAVSADVESLTPSRRAIPSEGLTTF
jgi:hypothetical protein